MVVWIRQLRSSAVSELCHLRCQLSTCRPGDTVLDVGANIGIFSLWASERVGPSGRVVAVEPLPPIFDTFVHNIAAHDQWCHRTGMPGCRAHRAKLGS